MKRKIFLDTNILLSIGQFGIDVFSEASRRLDFPHEFVVVDKVYDELAAMAGNPAGKKGNSARLAIALAKSKKVKIMKTGGVGADSSILEGAASHNGIIATQDRILIQKARAKNIPVLQMRQKKYFILRE